MSAFIKAMLLRRAEAKAQGAANAAAYSKLMAKAKGDVGMRWRGKYDPNAQYAVGDGVSQNGSSYIATAVTIAAPPGADWDELALKGKDGKAGKDGVNRVIYSGSGSDSVLTAGPADPLVAPDQVFVKQNGAWVTMLASDFAAMLGSDALPLSDMSEDPTTTFNQVLTS